MDSCYAIAETSEIVSPAMVVFRELVESNLREMLRIAGDPARLRPHCKTHKMPAIVKLELQAGITKHKCATLAEAEMLATAGVPDIVLAYNPVGPNIGRVIRFKQQFPQVKLAVTADHPQPVAQLGQAAVAAKVQIDVLLDIDSGQHRTGLPAGPQARELYERIAQTAGLVPGGFHLYDGQNHQTDAAARREAVMAVWEPAAKLRDELVAAGLKVPRILCGGTGSFPIFAALNDPVIELSPGTIIFHDANYRELFPDLKFTPAALLFTRVISRPTPNRVTLDLGYKAVASDPPAGKRLFFPDLPDAVAVLQNEEHLVLETSRAAEFQPGDALLAIPRHVCPTSALHKSVYVVAGGHVTETWDVIARDRVLTI
ncbi:D-threonine aldolase [Anatilimnocola aggregata]|uniref:D-threonine aldolase n=1 Tax=Anatilimnocola aggregata TaxID=2528021 RepID=A0A517Y4R2_9BACT|nr:D-TA family PLP-dependent enzyme [Anatilimnocola aggregata]QDU25112.1 D-threonine aldolase [Anatilimnocola aggregata]